MRSSAVGNGLMGIVPAERSHRTAEPAVGNGLGGIVPAERLSSAPGVAGIVGLTAGGPGIRPPGK
jgi:hypothetical protein